MNLFYTNDINNKDQLAYFGEEEARHCVQVLRKKIGDQLHFVDGQGGLYKGEIVETGKKKCVLKLLSHAKEYHKRDFYLHIAIAPTKNIARLEWFLEKATEIGVDEITLTLCDHSERKRIRIDRLSKIIMSAMKQSLKAYLPKLNDLLPYKDLVSGLKADNRMKYIAHCDYEQNIHLKEKYQKAKDVIIMIGPEGDFSKKEVAFAFEHGFEGVGLGKERLRTETAGIVACHTLNLLNQ